MSTKITDELLEEAAKVSSGIAAARRLMAEGEETDMPALEGQIQSLCENAEATDLEQSAEVQDALSALVEDLTRLNREMSDKLWDNQEKSVEDAAQRAIDSYKPDSKDN
jgi:hypothetical protein